MLSLLLAAFLPLSADAHPPIRVELASPTRISAMQPVGTQAGSGGAGSQADKATYQLFWAPYDMTAEAACFTVVSGSTTGAHELALLTVGEDGRPDELLWYSDPITVSGGGVYCATFTDTDGTVLDDVDLVNSIYMTKGEAFWLGFHRASGTGTAYYRTMYPLTALSLGQQYPGGPAVRHLEHAYGSGWVSDPPAADVSNGEPVIVSVEVGPPIL